MRRWIWLPIAAVGLGAVECSLVPARAEHFNISLSVQSATGRAEATWDTSPPEGGLNPRQAVTASAGEDLQLEWRLESEFPHGTMKKVVIRIYVAPEKEIGQRTTPAADTPRLVDNSFTADFLPHHRARGSFRFRVLQPGSYLVRLQSENTLQEHGHEHFGAVDLRVE